MRYVNRKRSCAEERRLAWTWGAPLVLGLWQEQGHARTGVGKVEARQYPSRPWVPWDQGSWATPWGITSSAVPAPGEKDLALGQQQLLAQLADRPGLVN